MQLLRHPNITTQQRQKQRLGENTFVNIETYSFCSAIVTMPPTFVTIAEKLLLERPV